MSAVAAVAHGPAVVGRTVSSGWPTRWSRGLAYALTVLPFVTASVRAIVNDWFPIGDSALLYLRAADVGTPHHPLLGSWSSASRSLGRNINNPGPIYADLVAPFAHVFTPGVGNAVGVATVNAAFVLGAALAARRIGGSGFEAWTLVAGAALAWTMGSELLFDMFQAHALLFPFLSALVLMVGAMTGHRFTWPWLVFVWSVVLQTHISYAYIATAILVVGLIVAIPQIPRPLRPWIASMARSRAAAWSLGVFAVLWTQPVVEQIFGDGEGNLTRLAQSAGGTDVNVGLGNAFRMVCAVFALPPFWTRNGFADTIQPAGTVLGPDGPVVSIPWLPATSTAAIAFAILLAALIVCLRWARQRGDRVLVAVCAIGLGGSIGSVVALSRLTVGSVGLAAHHTRWLFVLALWAHGAIVATAVRWWVARRADRPTVATDRRRTFIAVVVVIAVLAVANIPKYTQPHGPLADTRTMPALRRVFDQLAPLAADDPLLYRTDNLRVYEPYSSAIMAQLVERGIEFRVDDEVMVRQLGNGRRADGTERYTVTQLQGWDAYAFNGPACVLARASDVDRATEIDLAALADRLDDRARSLDVSAVATSTLMTQRDRELAARVAGGEPDAVHRATVEGWFAWWIDHDLVVGDPTLLGELVAARPPLMEWVGSTFVLTVSPADGCRD
jgi:hypothetical protein